MKIKDVKHYLLNPGWGKNLLFVKVITDNGLEGWGECYTQSDRDKTIIVHLEHMSNYLIGRDPFEIKYFNQIVFDDYASRRGSMEIFSAFVLLLRIVLAVALRRSELTKIPAV